MELPKQVRPVMRKGSTAEFEGGVNPAGFICNLKKKACKFACRALPEPAETYCKNACGLLC